MIEFHVFHRDNLAMENTEALRSFYEQNPFPRISLFAGVNSADAHLLNFEAGLAASFGAISVSAPVRPRILVVGGGTFEPYVVAKANPNAEIFALDLSQAALKKLKRRVFFHGQSRRVTPVLGDIRKPDPKWGKFHYIIATGVLHHLPDPEVALAAMDRLLLPGGVLRFMLYSKHGREGVYRLRRMAELLQIKTPREFRRMISDLPNNHPLRITFDLYTDAKTDEGLMDGFFHVCDEARDADGWRRLLSDFGFAATKFLHSPSGQPESLIGFSVSDAWTKLGILDRMFELETNFLFFAARKKEINNPPARHNYCLNPALIGAEGREIYSRIAGKFLKVPARLETNAELENALFLLRKETP
jgi:SAM-dependent methyltransferase